MFNQTDEHGGEGVERRFTAKEVLDYLRSFPEGRVLLHFSLYRSHEKTAARFDMKPAEVRTAIDRAQRRFAEFVQKHL